MQGVSETRCVRSGRAYAWAEHLIKVGRAGDYKNQSDKKASRFHGWLLLI